MGKLFSIILIYINNAKSQKMKLCSIREVNRVELAKQSRCTDLVVILDGLTNCVRRLSNSLALRHGKSTLVIGRSVRPTRMLIRPGALCCVPNFAFRVSASSNYSIYPRIYTIPNTDSIQVYKRPL